MTPEDFNDWRAENDIRQLLGLFDRRLPEFVRWRETFGIGDDLFCRVVPTAELLLGESVRVAYRPHDWYPTKVLYLTLESSKADYEKGCRARGENPPSVHEFEPYFTWVRNTTGRALSFPIRPGRPETTDTFQYTAWQAFNFPSASRETLLGELQVVKLGGVAIGEGSNIGMRNLDFADLDFLNIRGRFHGSSQANTSFSPCKHWSIEGSELNFFHFTECQVDGFLCDSSRLYKWVFSRTRGDQCRFVSSRLWDITLDRTEMVVDFNRCDLTDVRYLPDKGTSHVAAAETYRTLRSGYQEMGRRAPAASCFYLEQYERMRSFARPVSEYRNEFDLSLYVGGIAALTEKWSSGLLSAPKAVGLALQSLPYAAQVWIHPKHVVRTLGFAWKYICARIDWAVWGFGERPGRVVASAVSVVTAFTVLFWSHPGALAIGADAATSNPLLRSLYFSLVTFTTLGYGDIVPRADWMRIACATEAFCGVFALGLVVAAFANRSRY